MKRHLLLFAIIVCSVSLVAEDIPVGYYDAIDGLQDSILKSTLSLIVRGGDRYEYGTNQYHSSSNPPEWQKGDLKAYGTWQALPFTDYLPGNEVWDMYSNCVRYYPNKIGDSGCSLNIEHCLPKSWWGGTINEAYKDLYNLNPSDQRANNQKSNYPPGHVTKGDKFDNGSFRMDSKTKSRYGYICWEPAEEYRGDFARTYFYMATAYEYLEWTAYPDYISSASYLMFSDSIQQVLLDWHRADPVSDKELCRLDNISTIQGNRNPYIDYPELVEYIWGNRKGQAVDLSELDLAFQQGTCIIEEPQPDIRDIYDCIIYLPATTKNNISAFSAGTIRGNANSGIATNAYSGNASCVMGTGSTDGEITFTGLNLQDSATLLFRASPYNSATSMQLDVYADDVLLQSIQVSVVQETRHEVRYWITVPAGTQTLRMISVGGSTSKRACLQELYLLAPKRETTALNTTSAPLSNAAKQLRNGNVVIVRDKAIYTPSGQQIR